MIPFSIIYIIEVLPHKHLIETLKKYDKKVLIETRNELIDFRERKTNKPSYPNCLNVLEEILEGREIETINLMVTK